jgi:gliding motility-associated-like protein
MKEDLEMDERDGIDDLFRDTLGEYSQVPEKDLWPRLNSRLNRKELIYFVTFRGNPRTERIRVLPLYRQQWFRVAVAACLALTIVYASVLVTNSVTSDNVNMGKYIAGNKSINNPELIKGAGQHTSVANWEQIVNNVNIYTPKGNDYVADNNDRVRNIHRMPNVDEQPGLLSPINNHEMYADNNRTDRQSPRNNGDKDKQMNTGNNAVERNFSPSNNNVNNNQTLIADNGLNNNSNNPFTNINVRNGQKDADIARVNAARKVDSIIKANAIKENNIVKQQENNERDNYQSNETSTNIVLKNENTAEVVVPNIITPNGDGSNDYFRIKNLEYYTDNMLTILDRNGRTIIFQKKEYQGDWNADNVPDGTYIYVLTYKSIQKETFTAKGYVYVIR